MAGKRSLVRFKVSLDLVNGIVPIIAPEVFPLRNVEINSREGRTPDVRSS